MKNSNEYYINVELRKIKFFRIGRMSNKKEGNSVPRFSSSQMDV
jgi:hypothetical protein